MKCKNSSTGTGSITGWKNVTPMSSNALKNAVLEGPVSIAVDASSTAFQFYASGVVTTSTCGTKLDHGILAVGYGTEDGNDFFLVKNQWDTKWGDNGYIKIGAGDSNICGILTAPSYVIV
jgi:C1A family cysteine protease